MKKIFLLAFRKSLIYIYIFAFYSLSWDLSRLVNQYIEPPSDINLRIGYLLIGFTFGTVAFFTGNFRKRVLIMVLQNIGIVAMLIIAVNVFRYWGDSHVLKYANDPVMFWMLNMFVTNTCVTFLGSLLGASYKKQFEKSS